MPPQFFVIQSHLSALHMQLALDHETRSLIIYKSGRCASEWPMDTVLS